MNTHSIIIAITLLLIGCSDKAVPPSKDMNNDFRDLSTTKVEDAGVQDLKSTDTHTKPRDLEDGTNCAQTCEGVCCDESQICQNNKCVTPCDFKTESCGLGHLPLWYDAARIQGLVGANVRSTDVLQADIVNPSEYSQRFLNATKKMKSFGFPVFTRYVKNAWTEVPWPSAVPVGYLEDRADNLSWAVEDAHKTDFDGEAMRLGVYYRDTGEGKSARNGTFLLSHAGDYVSANYDWEMPESWLCKDLDGTPLKQTSELVFHADYASEQFREFTKIRLDEMASRGVDFIYFDERHLPSNDPIHKHGACFGDSMKDGYKGDMPVGLSTGLLNNGALKDWDNLNFRNYVIYQSKVLSETFAFWKEYVRQEAEKRGEKAPLFIISSTYLGMFTLPYMRLSLASIADSLKIEFDNGIRSSLSGYAFKNYDGTPPVAAPRNDIGRALNIVISRDASDGRPPNLWYHSLQDQYHVRSFVATAIGYGSIANLQVNDWLMTKDKPNRTTATSIENLKIGTAFGRAISPMMQNTRPYKYAAIHISEQIRDAIPNGKDGLWPKQVWKKLMWPISGAFQAFVDLHIPITIITDEQISRGDLEQYGVLFLPTEVPKNLEEEVRRFANNNGVVIQHDQSLNASLAEGKKEALDSIKKNIETQIRGSVPMQVEFTGLGSGTKKLHATYFIKNGDKDDIVVALINDFRFVEQALSGPKNPHPRYGPTKGDQIKLIVNFEVSDLKGYAINKDGELKAHSLMVEKKGDVYEISGLKDFREIAFIRFRKK